VPEGWAPGRVNLLGEHTDYNGGLALPFAVELGIRVVTGAPGDPELEPWARAVASELGVPAQPARAESTLPRGAGLASSAALTAALARALGGEEDRDALALARSCARAETAVTGAETGLLDQLAILLGPAGAALRIDFRTLATEAVPLALGGARLALLDSGARHAHGAAGGYAERRAECRAACAALGVPTLTDAVPGDAARLPEPLGRRLRHVQGENARVEAAVAALRAGHGAEALGPLLDASHASLRDLYDASVPEVEATVARAKAAGASGARMMGGGFGGMVLALFGAGVAPPAEAIGVRPR
jgi:galactokinase